VSGGRRNSGKSPLISSSLRWVGKFLRPSLEGEDRLRNRRTLLITVCALLAGAAAGTVAVPAGGATRPKITIVKKPPARTAATVAEFRFKTSARSTACRRDNLAYRRCRTRVRYRHLKPGRHTFTVRARHKGRTAYVRHRWTVLAKRPRPRPRPPAPPPPVTPPAAPPEAQALADPPPPPTYGRRLIFGDEFDGTALDPAVWDIYDGPGNENHGLRRPSAFSLDGQGNLVVTGQMVNGAIVSGGMGARLNFTYGRVETRVRTEPDPTGTMSADVLTWPEKQWAPEFTENDMYETGAIPNNTSEFSTFIHFGTQNWQKWTTHQIDPSQWHVVEMEWYPDMLEIYVDHALAFRVDDPYAIPDVLHHVCIQLDARATRALARPVRMFVDYIRVYQ
jgi:hypothetical protein